MPAINPAAYWPLIRFTDDDFTDAPESKGYFFTDAEMIALRVALRFVCTELPGTFRFGTLLESAREKIEQCLDVEFNEGRFAGGDVEPGALEEKAS